MGGSFHGRSTFHSEHREAARACGLMVSQRAMHAQFYASQAELKVLSPDGPRARHHACEAFIPRDGAAACANRLAFSLKGRADVDWQEHVFSQRLV